MCSAQEMILVLKHAQAHVVRVDDCTEQLTNDREIRARHNALGILGAQVVKEPSAAFSASFLQKSHHVLGRREQG